MAVCLVAASCSTRMDHAHEAVQLPDSVLNRTADSLYRLGERARKDQKPDSAVYFHNQALSLRESCRQPDVRLAYSYWRVGKALFEQVKVEAANRRLDMALAIADTASMPFDSLIAIYLQAAVIKGELLDYASSTSLITHALQLVRNQEPLDRGLLARCYRASAHAHHANKEFEDAVKSVREGMALLSTDAPKSAVASWNFAMAMSQRGLKHYDSTLYYLDRALEAHIAQSGRTSKEVSGVYLNKGDFFYTTGRYDSALFYLKKTLALRRELFGEKHVWTGGAYEALGDLFHNTGQYDSAIVYRQAQLRSVIKGFNSRDIGQNPQLQEEEITMDIVDYLVDKASTLRAMFTSDTTRVECLRQSLATYLLADSVYSIHQANLPFDDLALSQMDGAPVPYFMMMDVTERLHKITGDGQFLETALQIMQRSKAVVLKNALSRARSFEELGLPDDLAAREKTLLQHRSELVQLLASSFGTGSARDSISEEIVELDHQYTELKSVIAREQPNYHVLKYGSGMDLGRLRTIIDGDALWIDYLWGEDKVFILSAGRSEVTLHKVDITPGLVARIRSLTATVQQFNEASYTREYFKQFTGDAYALFHQLVAPALSGREVSRLVISPSGPLMAFPFEALISQRPEAAEIDYRLDYLVTRYDISYEYSSAFLENHLNSKRHGDKVLAMGFAGDNEESDTADDLPGARRELAAIQHVMNNTGNRYLLANEASEDEFKRNVEQFNLLHLAVHGIGDTVNSMKSHLVFRERGASEQDGKLFAYELYALDLRSVDMAVLSACESGVGRVQPGEGVMSIARGFRYAGCPSLIISLWKINDDRSSEVMSRFYSSLAEGVRIDRALAMAKRRYLADVNMLNSHPSFWAAFLAVGDTNPVDLSFRTSTLYMVWLASLGLLVIGWLVWKKRTSRLLTVQRG